MNEENKKQGLIDSFIHSLSLVSNLGSKRKGEVGSIKIWYFYIENCFAWYISIASVDGWIDGMSPARCDISGLSHHQVEQIQGGGPLDIGQKTKEPPVAIVLACLL